MTEEEDDWPVLPAEPGPCPVCEGQTSWREDCPGYPADNGRVLVCWPTWTCGNADFYECECGWWYREPNRRGNENMGIRPEWLNK